MDTPKFTFSGEGLLDGEDPLGVWEMHTPSPALTSLAASSVPAGLRWQVIVPSSVGPSSAAVWRQLAVVESRKVLLQQVERRLAELDLRSAQYAAADPHSAQLLAEVTALRSSARAFTSGTDEGVTYRNAYTRCDELLKQFRGLLSHYARIETDVGGRCVALTTVDWSGDYETMWLVEATAADMQLHLASVRLALASREAWLSLIAVVTSGALELALKTSVPGGQFLLLPAVYKYVRDVLREMAQLSAERTG